MAKIRIPRPWALAERLATPEAVYLDRRRILQGLGLGTLALTLPQIACAQAKAAADPGKLSAPALGARFADRFPAERNGAFTAGEGRDTTSEAVSSRYNNFYEFTTDKERVWELAQGYAVEPWTVAIKGLVKAPRTLALEDLFQRFPLEERLYRFRCVERWSMQIPWTGFPLRALIDHVEPLPSAQWVRFISVQDEEGLPGQKNEAWYPWPYFEALRLDEARHELAFVVLGSYGHALPMQHGAPLRIALPWKYGYKSAKSIVEIEFTERRPKTFWNKTAPREYGFFSNVDPKRPHPRWSQEWERDIGTGETRRTLPFNGYAEAVGSMYTGREV